MAIRPGSLNAPGEEREKKLMPADQIALRRRRVAELLVQRKTIFEISEILVERPRTIYRDRDFVEARWMKVATEDIAKIKSRELAELRQMERVAIENMEAIAKQNSPEWFDRRMKVKERIAKMHGLDAPLKTEVAGPGGKPIELTAIRERFLAKLDSITAARNVESAPK